MKQYKKPQTYIDSKGNTQQYKYLETELFHFRDENYNNLNKIDSLLFGDSHVFGEGLKDEETISNNLRLLGNNAINYGIAGSSNFCTFRVLLNYYDKDATHFIFITFPDRLEYIDKRGNLYRISRKQKTLNEAFKEYYTYISNDYYDCYLLLYWMLSVQYFCLCNKLKYYFVNIYNLINYRFIINNKILYNFFKNIDTTKIIDIPKNYIIDYTYDNSHYGVNTSKNIADICIKYCKSN